MLPNFIGRKIASRNEKCLILSFLRLLSQFCHGAFLRPVPFFPFLVLFYGRTAEIMTKERRACVPLFPLGGFSLKRLPVRTAIGRFFPPFFLNHGFSRLYSFSVPPFLFVFSLPADFFMRLFKRSRKISPPFFGNSAFSPFLFSFFRFFLACSLFSFRPRSLASRVFSFHPPLSPLVFPFRE